MRRLLLLFVLCVPVWASPEVDQILQAVTRIHGGPGVFATAGYRIGAHARQHLQGPLEVVHRTPFQVQYSCVADGLQAATGVSPGKLNLRLEEVEVELFETVVRSRQNGQELRYRLRPEFVQRHWNMPREEQAERAREVLQLPEEAVFQVR